MCGRVRVVPCQGWLMLCLLARYFDGMTRFVSPPPPLLHQQYNGPLALLEVESTDQMVRSHGSQVAKHARHHWYTRTCALVRVSPSSPSTFVTLHSRASGTDRLPTVVVAMDNKASGGARWLPGCRPAEPGDLQFYDLCAGLRTCHSTCEKKRPSCWSLQHCVQHIPPPCLVHTMPCCAGLGSVRKRRLLPLGSNATAFHFRSNPFSRLRAKDPCSSVRVARNSLESFSARPWPHHGRCRQSYPHPICPCCVQCLR